MFTNGSMEAAALLFRYMIEPGDRVIVEQPSYDRTLLLLGRTGAELVAGSARVRRRRPRRVRGGARRRAGQARPHHPQLPQPGRLHALGRQARAPGRARRRARLLDLRGRPLSPDQVRRRRAAADDAVDRHIRTRDPRVFVFEDGQPRRARRLSRRAGRADQDARQARVRALHLAEHARRVDGARALPLRRARREHRVVNEALAERRDALVDALEEQLPEAEFVVPGGGYFLWIDLPDDYDTVAALEAAKGEGVAFVAGPDFLLEGGRSSLRLVVRERPRRARRRRRRPPRPRARVGPRRQPGVVLFGPLTTFGASRR